MDDMQALHDLDAFVTWQGGFDYYFAHVEDEEISIAAREALKRNGFGAAASLFERARFLFKNMAAVASPDGDETGYLAKVGSWTFNGARSFPRCISCSLSGASQGDLKSSASPAGS